MTGPAAISATIDANSSSYNSSAGSSTTTAGETVS
jgi:hypothetical protein